MSRSATASMTPSPGRAGAACGSPGRPTGLRANSVRGLLLSLLLATSWEGRAQGVRLVGACAITTLWAALLALSSQRGAVPEAIAARHMGARVLGISLVTALAAGISPVPLSHEEVQATGLAARGRFTALLDALLPALAS